MSSKPITREPPESRGRDHGGPMCAPRRSSSHPPTDRGKARGASCSRRQRRWRTACSASLVIVNPGPRAAAACCCRVRLPIEPGTGAARPRAPIAAIRIGPVGRSQVSGLPVTGGSRSWVGYEARTLQPQLASLDTPPTGVRHMLEHSLRVDHVDRSPRATIEGVCPGRLVSESRKRLAYPPCLHRGADVPQCGRGSSEFLSQASSRSSCGNS